ALTSSLRRLTSRPETLRHFTDAMTGYAQQAGFSTAPTSDSTSPVASRVGAALWKAQAGAYLEQAEITDAAIAEQYVVDAGLLDTGGADPRDLQWLKGTSVRAGALALWEDGPESGRLKVVGEYGAANAKLKLMGKTLTSE